MPIMLAIVCGPVAPMTRGSPIGGGRRGEPWQVDDKLGATAEPFAVGFDTPAMEFDQPIYNR